jgi:hypothetical protein
MDVVAKVIVGILCILIVGGVWALLQKFTALITGQAQGDAKQEWLGIGIGILVLAAMIGVAAVLAYVAGV